MRYLKTFEGRTVDPNSIKALNQFLEEYNNRKSYYNEHSEQRAKNYKIPEIFHEEFSLLYRLYEVLSYAKWNYRDKSETNYIKKEVKKKALESIKKKFEEDEKYYFALKKVFDDRPKWNDTGSFDGVSDGIVKNIFYLFEAALRNPPDIVVNIGKYNI